MSLVKVSRHFPHAATTRADRINIIHCAARSCKVLCEINAERTDNRMINILEELANDNLHPNSRFYRRNTAFDLATKKVADTESALCAALNESEKRLLADYTKAQDEAAYLSRTDKFIYGYRLGVLMTMEVFRTSDDIVTGGEVE